MVSRLALASALVALASSHKSSSTPTPVTEVITHVNSFTSTFVTTMTSRENYVSATTMTSTVTFRGLTTSVEFPDPTPIPIETPTLIPVIQTTAVMTTMTSFIPVVDITSTSFSTTTVTPPTMTVTPPTSTATIYVSPPTSTATIYVSPTTSTATVVLPPETSIATMILSPTTSTATIMVAPTTLSVPPVKRSATATVTMTVPAPTDVFHLKVEVPGKKSHFKSWNNKFLSAILSGGDEEADVVLNNTESYAPAAHLVNGNIYFVYPQPLYMTYDTSDTTGSADWTPVVLDDTQEVDSTMGFMIMDNKLIGSSQNYWYGWLLCKWVHDGTPQLFARLVNNSVTIDGCTEVNVIVENTGTFKAQHEIPTKVMNTSGAPTVSRGMFMIAAITGASLTALIFG